MIDNCEVPRTMACYPFDDAPLQDVLDVKQGLSEVCDVLTIKAKRCANCTRERVLFGAAHGPARARRISLGTVGAAGPVQYHGPAWPRHDWAKVR